jgi:hypothetical protein
MQFSYTTNVQDVISELNAAAADAKPAVVRALNKTMDRVKVRAARLVRDTGYNLLIRDIKDAIRVSKASSSRLRADAMAKGRPIPLIKYGAKEVKNGVSVNVLNGRRIIPHAFIATMPNGAKHVCIREPNAKHLKKSKNGVVRWTALPIKVLFGPAIPDALANKAVSESLIALMGERFPVILEHEHAFLSKRLTRKQSLPAE